MALGRCYRLVPWYHERKKRTADGWLRSRSLSAWQMQQRNSNRSVSTVASSRLSTRIAWRAPGVLPSSPPPFPHPLSRWKMGKLTIGSGLLTRLFLQLVRWLFRAASVSHSTVRCLSSCFLVPHLSRFVPSPCSGEEQTDGRLVWRQGTRAAQRLKHGPGQQSRQQNDNTENDNT